MRSIIFIIISLLLATNNIFVNFRIGFISYDRLLEFLIFFMFINTFIEEFINNHFFKKFSLFVFVLAVIQLLLNLKLAAFYQLESKDIIVDVFKSLSFIVFSFLFYLIVKEDLKYLKLIIVIHIGICIFALLQHPFSPISAQVHEMKLFLFENVDSSGSVFLKLKNQETYINYGIGDRFRLSGPFASTTTFSYFLLSTLMLNLFMFLRTNKRAYIGALAFITLCAILTQTRSLVGAIGLIYLGVFLFINNNKINSYKVIATIIGLVCVFAFMNKIESVFESNTTRLTNINTVNDGRPLLWLTGILAIAEYPFGISSEQYDKVRIEMSKKFNEPSIRYLYPHNGVINFGFYYSSIGYLIIVMFFAFILKQLKLLSTPFRYIFYFYFAGYLLNAFFHNNFIFITDYDVLMVTMLIPLQYFFEQKSQTIQ